MRLIDADAIEKELWRIRYRFQVLDDTQAADRCMYGLHCAEQVFENAEVIRNVVPERHATWGLLEHTDEEGITEEYGCCTACWEHFYGTSHEELKRWNYCPNCGADMRERKDDV